MLDFQKKYHLEINNKIAIKLLKLFTIFSILIAILSIILITIFITYYKYFILLHISILIFKIAETILISAIMCSIFFSNINYLF